MDESLVHPTGMLKFLRDEPPAHYKIKIDSFSVLLTQKIDKYESAIFETGGFKWRLTLYLDGNEDQRGGGYVSLYVAIAETKDLPVGWEANINIKMFVYDHYQDKYLTIEDGRLRRLHDMKTECGFRQLLSMDAFKDSTNGYLVNDSCIFGVELWVVKYSGKGETVSLLNNPEQGTYTWKIENFSSRGDEIFFYSDEFTIGERKWNLLCYPKGNGTNKDKSVSLYLEIADSENLPPGWKLYVSFKLRTKSQFLTYQKEWHDTKWFCASTLSWGFPDFLPLADLKNASRAFAVNDSLVVECEISVLSLVRYSL